VEKLRQLNRHAYEAPTTHAMRSLIFPVESNLPAPI
jgi:hypothetical protein